MSMHKEMTRLQVERLRRGFSQTMLAAKAGRLSGADINRFENHYARPYAGQAKRIARVLNLDPDELLEPVDEQC